MGLAATIFGALAGGALMVNLGLYRSLMLFGILQAARKFENKQIEEDKFYTTGDKLGISRKASNNKLRQIII